MIRGSWILFSLVVLVWPATPPKKPDCIETCITKTAMPCYDKCVSDVVGCQKKAEAKCKDSKDEVTCIEDAFKQCEKNSAGCEDKCNLALNKCVDGCVPNRRRP